MWSMWNNWNVSAKKNSLWLRIWSWQSNFSSRRLIRWSLRVETISSHWYSPSCSTRSHLNFWTHCNHTTNKSLRKSYIIQAKFNIYNRKSNIVINPFAHNHTLSTLSWFIKVVHRWGTTTVMYMILIANSGGSIMILILLRRWRHRCSSKRKALMQRVRIILSMHKMMFSLRITIQSLQRHTPSHQTKSTNMTCTLNSSLRN